MSQHAPRVDVVINCLNAEAYLAEAIESVLAQTYTDWQIVLVDNASTDATPEIARRYQDRITYVRNAHTVPLGEARNIALRVCRGEFIAFLDSDDIWYPTKLEKQIRLFANPRVDLVYSNTHLIRDGRIAGTRYTSSADYAVGHCFDKLIGDYFVVLSSAVIRRSALERLDEWFDPELHVAEEADVFVRLAIGGELQMVDEPLAAYRMHLMSDTVRKGDMFAPEIEKILQKLDRLMPDFRAKYGDEAGRWIDKGLWAKAVAAWRSGQGRVSRRAIRDMRERRAKHYALFLASALPYGLYRRVWERGKSSGSAA